MKTIFNKEIRDLLIQRINILPENNTTLWGKMNIRQMVKHCTIWDKMALGKTQHKQAFLGVLFGRMALKDFVGDDKPLKKNIPGSRELNVKGPVSGNFAEDKKQWISLIEEYAQLPGGHEIKHPFFGKLTREQVGILAYKHTDHHLRQFNG